MALILADTRETHGANNFLHSAVDENNRRYKDTPLCEGGGELSFKVQEINTGDYAVLRDGRLCLVIERKTWADLAGSIKDGRMERQQRAMAELRDQDIRAIYLIEGIFSYKEDKQIGRMAFSSLHSKIRHNLLRGLPFIQSRDEEHSARIIVKLARDMLMLHARGEIQSRTTMPRGDIMALAAQYSNSSAPASELAGKIMELCNPVSAEIVAEDTTPEISIVGRKQISNEDIYTEMWASIKGVSRKSAVILSEKWHIGAIICGKVKHEDIAALVFPSGKKFGRATAAKIMALEYSSGRGLIGAQQQDMYIRILSKIPGITAETAATVLDNFSMRDICSGFVIYDQIADIKKNNGRRVGPVAAQRLYEIMYVKS